MIKATVMSPSVTKVFMSSFIQVSLMVINIISASEKAFWLIPLTIKRIPLQNYIYTDTLMLLLGYVVTCNSGAAV